MSPSSSAPKAGLGAEANTSFASTKPTADARFGQALAAARFTGATDADEMAVLDDDGAQLFAFHTDILHLMGTLNTTTQPGGHRIQPAYLTTGDYDRNGFADLVVSGYSPDDDYQQGWSALYAGGDTKLTYRQDLNGGLGTASGDINHDGYDDLVVGQLSSADDQAEGDDGGKIAVYYGSSEGTTGPADWWSQNSRAYPERRSTATPGATTSPSVTSTATATRTSPSARPARTSAPSGTRAPYGCCAVRATA